MCVIITSPMGAHVSIETLEACWKRNDDGAGIAWATDGHLQSEKGFMDEQDFFDYLGDPEEWDDFAVMYHFRIRTHGDADEVNTHPFEVIPGKLVFAHNGIITDMKAAKKPELSDTAVFAKYVLQQLPHNFLNNKGIEHMIFKTVGTSRLAFLGNEGDFTIYNHDKGGAFEREDGVWFSNNHWKPVKTYGYNKSTAGYGVPAKPVSTYGKTTPVNGKSNSLLAGWSWNESEDRRLAQSKQGFSPTRSLAPAPAVSFHKPVVTDAEIEGLIEEASMAIAGDWYCCDCALWFEGNRFIRDKCPTCGSVLAVIDPTQIGDLNDLLDMDAKGESHE